jgi:hypothetical protein
MDPKDLTDTQLEQLCNNKPFLKTLADMLEDEIIQFSSKYEYDGTKRLDEFECNPAILKDAIGQFISNDKNLFHKTMKERIPIMKELVKQNLKVAGGKKTKKRNKKRKSKSRRRS